jgi:DNA-binding response OmpR family regulator
MTALAADDLILARLADLEFENAMLKRALCEPPHGWSGAFRLSRAAYTIVSMVARASPRAVHKDRIVEIWEDDGDSDGVYASIETTVCHARKLLKPHGVEIKTARRLGYWMPEASRDRFDELLRAPT